MLTEKEDPVNSPHHYRTGDMETIDVLEAKLSPEQFRGFCIGNALKYLTRHNYKGHPEQDLRKAHWYLSRVIGEPKVDLVDVKTGEPTPLQDPRSEQCILPGCLESGVTEGYCGMHFLVCFSNKEKEDLRAKQCIFPGCRELRDKGTHCSFHSFLDGQPTQEDR